MPSAAIRAAAPKPAIAAMFSVPERWPFSCPPPRIRAAGIIISPRDDQSTGPLRPADLVRRDNQEIRAERLDRDRKPAERLHGVNDQDTAMRLDDATTTAATGWIIPVSLLASITATIGRPVVRSCPASAASSAARSIMPCGVTAISLIWLLSKRPPSRIAGCSIAET